MQIPCKSHWITITLFILQKIICNSELKPLNANSPEALVRHIKWASTAVLKSASSPAAGAEVPAGTDTTNVPIPTIAPAPVDARAMAATGTPNAVPTTGTPADPNDPNAVDDVW